MNTSLEQLTGGGVHFGSWFQMVPSVTEEEEWWSGSLHGWQWEFVADVSCVLEDVEA